MPSSIENTTSLGGMSGRITKRQFADITSRSVSGAIARSNYQRFIMSNAKLQKLRIYVFKMVSNWSYEDKWNIIREYGDSNLLRNNPSEGKLNKQVTETLIINMKQEDLEILLKDIVVDEMKIAKDVKVIRTKYKKVKVKKDSHFTTRSFEEVYSNIREMKKPKDIQKYLKAYEKRYKVPKYVASQYGNLKKEVFQVLRDMYNKVELAGLALQMKIDFSDGDNFKKIATSIANKILLYVDLIVGKSKKGYSSAIIDGIDAYNEVLQYTSFAFVTGKSGLKSKDLEELRKNAKMAKAQVLENFRKKEKDKETRLQKLNPLRQTGKLVKGATSLGLRPLNALLGTLTGTIGGVAGGIGNIFRVGPGIKAGFGKGKDLGAGFLENLILGRGSYQERKLAKSARDRVSGSVKLTATEKAEQEARKNYLSDMAANEPQKLINLAKEYNVPTERKKIDKIAEEVMIALEKQAIRKAKLEKERDIATKRGKIFKKQAELDVLNKDLQERKEKEFWGAYGTNIPYLHINQNININNLPEVALPVYVVNDLLHPLKNREELTGLVVKNIEYMNEVTANWLEHISNLITGHPTQVNNISNGPVIDQDMMERTARDIMNVNIMPKRSSEKIKTTDVFTDSPKAGEDRREKYAKRRMDTDTTIFRGLNQDHPFVAKFSKGTNQPFDTEGTYGIRVMDMSSIFLASKMKESGGGMVPHFAQPVIEAGITSVKKEPATPVYVINKDLDVTTKTDQAADKLKDLALKMALNSVGLGFLAPVLGLATGGRGRGPRFAKGTVSSAQSAMTQFVAGDSLNGKPNEEQVNIDWNKKTFDVKPIPKMTQSSLAESGISKVSQLSQAERIKPMSVGITSHTVAYNRTLKYATENGGKEAIKVYPVTPGIDDEIDYNGNKVSAIGLMAEMALRLSNIEGLLSIGNQQREAVIDATRTTAVNISKMGSSSKQASNPFLGNGFPSSLDSILKGD